MSNTNAESATKKERKPRTKQTPAMLLAKAKEIQKRAALEQAREALSQISDFATMKDAVKTHKKYLFEGKSLTDDTKYSARVELLQKRLSNLQGKRTIAVKDVARRENVVARFEEATTKIGEKILAAVEKGESIDGAALVSLFNNAVSPADRAVLLDTTDPYSAYRRQKNSAASNEDGANADSPSTEGTDDSDSEDDVFGEDDDGEDVNLD